MNRYLKLYRYIINLCSFLFVLNIIITTYAFSSNIDHQEKYAWSENIGWINFRPDNNGLTIYDNYIKGYFWSENIGWVLAGSNTNGPYENNSDSNWGVNIDESGKLSGFAWSENTGWINFSSNSTAKINLETGLISGFVWSENIGYIHLTNSEAGYELISPRISVNDTIGPEHKENIIFTFLLSKALSNDISLEYQTIDQTAIAGIDYSSCHQTTTIKAGSTSHNITIPVFNDDLSEDNKSFLLKILNADDVSFYNKEAKATIVDDETHRLIMAKAYGNGNIIPSGGIPVPIGNDQGFAFAPQNQYHIAEVRIDGIPLGLIPQGTYLFENVTKDYLFEIIYDINKYVIRANSDENGTISPQGEISVNAGSNQSFVLTPDENYHIVNLKVDGVSLGPLAEYTFENVKQIHTIDASFAINRYTITVDSGSNGSIFPKTCLVDHGSDQIFMITPDERFHIKDVVVDSVSVGQVNMYKFENVMENHSIYVDFEITRFKISVKSGSGGNITPQKDVEIEYGNSITFEINADRPLYSEECDVKDVKVDGISLGPMPFVTFYNIVSNHSIEAEFYCTLKVCSSGCFYYSIQDAISGSKDNDLVIVKPGVYNESISFLGKSIHVTGENGSIPPEINAKNLATAVKFVSGEGEDTKLSNFIIKNGKGSLGGGVYINNSSPVIENCTIENNKSLIKGGGIYIENNSSPVISRAIIINNTSDGNGAGIFIASNSDPQIINTIIAENSAVNYGGGFYVQNSSAAIYNTTVSNNSALTPGTVIMAEYNSWVLVHNSILESFYPDKVDNIIKKVNSQVTVTYSDINLIDWQYPGFGNINVDPLLTDDYHLTIDSRCKDSASQNNAPEFDFEGQSRPMDAGIDMGADEYMSLTPKAVFYANSTTGYAPLNVVFTENSSSPLTITKWIWDFGDGTIVEYNKKRDTYHKYEYPGKYTVKLTIFDTSNNSKSHIRKDVVEVKPKDMSFEFTCDKTLGYQGISIKCTPHLNSFEFVKLWTWDFGDGTIINNEKPESGYPSNHNYSQSHTYTETGIYTLSLSIIDGINQKSTRKRYNYITIQSRLPKADFWATPVVGNAPVEVQFYDKSSAFDTITSWEWNFGDETTSNEQNPSHIYTLSGEYTVKLTIKAGDETDTIVKDEYIRLFEAQPSLTVCSTNECNYTSIQSAIDNSKANDIIVVKPGIYRELIDFKSKPVTVKSEQGAEDTYINGDYKGSVVKFVNGEQSGSVLDGFTIQNGLAKTGAGILISVFENDDNEKIQSNPTIQNCVITNNNASETGGGIDIIGSNPNIILCNIFENTAIFGAGISIRSFSEPDIRWTTITGNEANENGGGIYVYSSSPNLSELEIKDNWASVKGGGIYFQDTTLKPLINILMIKNSADYGGALYYKNVSSALVNFCTMADNRGLVSGDGIYASRSSIILNNSILYNGGDEIYLEPGSDIRVSYSNIKMNINEIYTGTNNINEDPKFIMPGKDFHLDEDSPCKNIALSTSAPSEDIERNSRPQGSGYDIGAYEADNISPIALSLELTTDEDISISLTLQASDKEMDLLEYSIIKMPEHGTLEGDMPELVYIPEKDYYGEDFFTYKSYDGFVNSNTATIKITIRPVNDPPIFIPGDSVTVIEDSGEHMTKNWASHIRPGPVNEIQDIVFIVSASNEELFSNIPKISSDGNLSFTPALNANGKTKVFVNLQDNGGIERGGIDTGQTFEFFINIYSVNDRPAFDTAGDIEVIEDDGLINVPNWARNISPGPYDESEQKLNFILASDSPGFFSIQPSISVDGKLSFTLIPNIFGTATLSVILKDDGGKTYNGQDESFVKQFKIIVNPVNDIPSFTKGTDIMVYEDSGQQTFANWASNISAGPSNESDQSLEFYLTTDRPEFFESGPQISSIGTLKFIPANQKSGTARVWCYLKDSGGILLNGQDKSKSQEFVITIIGVNDPPMFTKGSDQKIPEDSGPQTIENWATNIYSGPDDEQSQSLIFHLETDNDELFESKPQISFDGTLSYISAQNKNGVANISVYLEDSGISDDNNQSISDIAYFKIEILNVNDAPVFTKGDNIVLMEDSGNQSITKWATNINAGPSDEQTQLLTFKLTIDQYSELKFSKFPEISSDGRLFFTPEKDSYGNATISVQLVDNGGTEYGGNDTSISAKFSIEVMPVNDKPVFTKGLDQTILEDAGYVEIVSWADDISAGPENEISQRLNFLVSTNNDSLFEQIPSVTYDGTLFFQVHDNLFGEAEVTVTLKDSGGIQNQGKDTTAPQFFKIKVLEVNDPPSFNIGFDQKVLEDSDRQIIEYWASNITKGPENESNQSISFILSTNNNELFSELPVISSSGHLQFKGASNQSGYARVSVLLKDSGDTINGGENTSIPQYFSITIVDVNDRPEFTINEKIEVLEDCMPQKIFGFAGNISPGPEKEASQNLSFIFNESQKSLFSQGPVIDAKGTLIFTLANNVNGSAEFNVKLIDDGGVENYGINESLEKKFTISIIPVNDKPSFTKGEDIEVFEDCGPQIFNGWAKDIISGPPDELGQNISFFVSTSNDNLFEQKPEISQNGKLTFTPKPDANGRVTVTVYLEDDGSIINGGYNVSNFEQFTIEIIPINDKPEFTPGSDITVNEDCGAVSIANWAIDIQNGSGYETQQSLKFIVTTNNDDIFPTPPVITSAGELNFTPAENMFGIADISVKLQDDGDTENNGKNTSDIKHFKIIVNSVNDAPVFKTDAFINVLEDSGSVTFNSFVKNISPGAYNESSQGLQFIVNTFNEELFTAIPAISSNGTLSFAPKNNISGQTRIEIILKDTGSLENGGENTSLPAVVVLNIIEVNDRPTFTKGADQVVLEDTGFHLVHNWATNISPGPEKESNQIFYFQVETNNNDLFNGSVLISSVGSLAFTPASDANGSATISVYLIDNGGIENNGVDKSLLQYFSINILGINDAPSFKHKNNPTIIEDSGFQRIENWAYDISSGNLEKNQSILFNVLIRGYNQGSVIDNSDFFEILPKISSDGALTFASADDVNGVVLLSVYIEDDGGTDNGGKNRSIIHDFNINVLKVNDPPFFTKGPDISCVEDSPEQLYPNWATNINPGKKDEIDQNLEFLIETNNDSLFAKKPEISSDGQLKFTPKPDAYGSATVSVYLIDDGGTDYQGKNISSKSIFNITVLPVNDSPYFEIASSNLLIIEDKGFQTYPSWAGKLSKGPENESNQTLKFNLNITNKELFLQQPQISADGTLTFAGAKDAYGTSTISVSLDDDGGLENGGNNSCPVIKSFNIQIVSVNDRPSFTKGADIRIFENAGQQKIPNWATNILAGPPNESEQKITFYTQVNNTSLFETQPLITSNGELIFTPMDNTSGSTTVQIYLQDDGGTQYGGLDKSIPVEFIITVNSVNNAPFFTPGIDVTCLEDSGKQIIQNWATQISPGHENENNQTVSFVVSTEENNLLWQNPAITSDGTLTFYPAPDMYGSVKAFVYLEDTGGTANGGINTSSTYSFNITILPVNDPPDFIKGENIKIYENTFDQNIGNFVKNISTGGINELNQEITFFTSTNNDDLFSQLPKILPDGTLSFSPASGVNGSATVFYYAKDNGGITNNGQDQSISSWFTITIIPVNENPTFTKGHDLTVYEDCGIYSLSGWATNISPQQDIEFVVEAENNDLFLIKPYVTSTGKIGFTPLNNVFGSSIVKIYLKSTRIDNPNTSATRQFTISILPVNDPPVFKISSDQSINEDSGFHTVYNFITDISAGPANEADQTLEFIITSKQESLFSVFPEITPDGTLTYATAPDLNGIASLSVKAKDTGGIENNGQDTSQIKEFLININSVNDMPSFVKGPDIVCLEDSGTLNYQNWAAQIIAESSPNQIQNITFHLNTDNPTLFKDLPTVSSDGTLRFTPEINENGKALVSIYITDDGGVAYGGQDTGIVKQFTITIEAVNDAPFFTKGQDQITLEDSGIRLIDNWAKNISPGALNEYGQNLNFIISTNNDSLFSVKPEIDIQGTLSYQGKQDANGSAIVTVYLTDSSGTLNNGKDTSDIQRFVITISPVNDPPENSSITQLVTGSPYAGKKLYAVTDTWNDNKDKQYSPAASINLTFEYQWQILDDINSPNNIENILNANSNSYLVTNDDLNKYIRLSIKVTDSGIGTPLNQQTTAYSDFIKIIKTSWNSDESEISLKDIINAIKIISGILPEYSIDSNPLKDINQDGVLDLKEVIYYLWQYAN